MADPIIRRCTLLLFSLLALEIGTAQDSGESSSISIATLIDMSGFPWSQDMLELTVSLINNKTDGWFDDVLPDTHLDMSFSEEACDEDVAVRAYLDLIRNTTETPHAVLGCRCSGPSMGIARLVSAEDNVMVSPTSSSPKLSNKGDFPTFSRLVGPDNLQGQVGSLIKLVRFFGWDRVSIIATNNEYSRGLYSEFAHAWEGPHKDGEDSYTGELGYKGIVQMIDNDHDTEDIDPASVRNMFQLMEAPETKCRIIILFAHHQHAFPILKIAQEMGFQKDTVWIGTDAWTDRFPSEGWSWMPPIPGYIGLTPARNRTSPVYRDFLGRWQDHQSASNKSISGFLPDSADRTVDALLALSMAFSRVPPSLRRNGTYVSSVLRGLVFDGVSGRVEFNSLGDIANPIYEVMTLPSAGTDWIPLGIAATERVTIDTGKICFAGESFCVREIPSDSYPFAKPLDSWVVALLALLGTVAIVLAVVMYLLRSKWKKSTTLSERLKLLQDEIGEIDARDSSVRKKRVRLYKEFARLLGEPTPWPDGAPSLVEIDPKEKEYWSVLEKLRETMGEECHLSKLTRIQNDAIWSYYVFRKNQLANKYKTTLANDRIINELDVWHGTSSLNPDVIHSNNQHGFMMQHSLRGLYGRGIYFSEKSGYSDCYSHRVALQQHVDDSFQGDREMFLVKLLLGRSKELDHKQNDAMANFCRQLVIPPEGGDDLGYDSVTGESDCGTRIHVVYDNGRAYPQYLVRYYKGPRDPARTKYCSFNEATKRQSFTRRWSRSVSEITIPTLLDSDLEIGSPTSSSQDPAVALPMHRPYTWEFEHDTGSWMPFSNEMQEAVEQYYQENVTAKFPIQTDLWRYEIDLGKCIQTNLDHPDHTERRIRRRVNMT